MIRLLFVFVLSACTYLQTDTSALCGTDAPSTDAQRTVDATPGSGRWIVLAGQSNATGQGVASQIDPSIAAPFPAVRFVATVGFDPSQHLILNHDGALQPRGSGGFGPELTLGRALPQYDILKIAIGGSSLATSWAPNGTWPATQNLYDQAIALIQKTIGTSTVVAFVWVQGEADANNLAWSQAYGANLVDFAVHIHGAFPGTLFVYNELSIRTTLPYKAAVRAGQEAHANDAGMRMINVDDLGIGSYHFTSQGLLDLGNRLARAIGGG